MAHWSGSRSGWNERGRPNDLRQKLIEKQETEFKRINRMLGEIRAHALLDDVEGYIYIFKCRCS